MANIILASITDEKIKISNNDTNAADLSTKLVSGANVTLTELNDGANESLEVGFTETAQNLIDTVTADTGTFSPDNPNDELNVVGLGGIATSISGDTLSIDGSSVAGSGGSGPLPTELAFQYEANDPNLFKDEKGGADLVEEGTVPSTDGNIGDQAWEFTNNTANRLTAAAGVHNTGDTNWFIGCWVNYTSTGAFQALFSKDRSSNSERNVTVGISANNDILFATYNNNVGEFLSTPANSLTPGTWHHVLCVHDADNDTMTTYIDGVEEATVSGYPNSGGAPQNLSIPTYIGVRETAPSTFALPVDGAINQLVFGEFVPTLEQIEAIAEGYENAQDAFDGLPKPFPEVTEATSGDLVGKAHATKRVETIFDMATDTAYRIDLTNGNLEPSSFVGHFGLLANDGTNQRTTLTRIASALTTTNKPVVGAATMFATFSNTSNLSGTIDIALTWWDNPPLNDTSGNVDSVNLAYDDTTKMLHINNRHPHNIRFNCSLTISYE